MIRVEGSAPRFQHACWQNPQLQLLRGSLYKSMKSPQLGLSTAEYKKADLLSKRFHTFKLNPMTGSDRILALGMHFIGNSQEIFSGIYKAFRAFYGSETTLALQSFRISKIGIAKIRGEVYLGLKFDDTSGPIFENTITKIKNSEFKSHLNDKTISFLCDEKLEGTRKKLVKGLALYSLAIHGIGLKDDIYILAENDNRVIGTDKHSSYFGKTIYPAEHGGYSILIPMKYLDFGRRGYDGSKI